MRRVRTTNPNLFVYVEPRRFTDPVFPHLFRLKRDSVGDALQRELDARRIYDRFAGRQRFGLRYPLRRRSAEERRV